AVERAGLVAGAAHDSAHRIDTLDRGRAREHTIATPRRHFELEPGHVIGTLAGRVGEHLAGDATAIGVIPVRAGVVASDRLAVEKERRNRLAECPPQPCTRARPSRARLHPPRT